MNIEEARVYCLSLPGVTEDMPYGPAVHTVKGEFTPAAINPQYGTFVRLHSTVTLFARLRGMSTLSPLSTAM